VRSWLLIGLAGWLVGTVVATAGSMYAIDQLGRGLLDRPASRVSIALVNSELARASSEHPVPPPTHSPGTSSATSPAPRAAAVVPATRARPRPPASQGRLIDTAGGTAAVACGRGGARLLYAIPRQGFSVRDPQWGPSFEASVTFSNTTGWLVLRVVCTEAGYPLKRLSTFGEAAGSPR
jgi:hypothetical protein